MRTPGHVRFLAIVAKSAIGACCGAALYAVYGFSTMRHSMSFNVNLLAELPFWLLVMAATTWPVAVGSAVVGRVGRSATTPWSLAALPIMAAVSGTASILMFDWYMQKLAPATHWSSAWLLPLASSFFAFVFACIPIRRADQRTVPI